MDGDIDLLHRTLPRLRRVPELPGIPLAVDRPKAR
jgi:hypothetical protein